MRKKKLTYLNVGADIGYYCTETLGVGWLTRFSRATVDVPFGWREASRYFSRWSTRPSPACASVLISRREEAR